VHRYCERRMYCSRASGLSPLPCKHVATGRPPRTGVAKRRAPITIRTVEPNKGRACPPMGLMTEPISSFDPPPHH